MQSHYVMLGVFAAATLGTGYVMTGHPISAPAIAQEQQAEEPFEFGDFLRIDDKLYQLSFDDDIDRTARSTQTITKIGYGHESEVLVVTTSTGTYSSDSLASPNVLYPGVSATERSAYAAAGASQRGPWWSMPVGPARVYLPGTPSFIHVVPTADGGQAIVSNDLSCTVTRSTVICY